MIVDMHLHLVRQQGYEHALARAGREAGIDKLVVMGGPEQYEYATNDELMAAADRYPDLFVPFGYFRLGRDYPGMVDELHSRGFRGLQFALPQKDYDDREYYLVYARAGQLGMPAVFQLGLLPNSGRDHQFNVCCSRMRPIHLDTIARAFPELTLIGTRLGCPWYEEASEVARCNHNVYLDLSGAVLRTKGPEFVRAVLWWGDAAGERNGRTDVARPWEKIVFGSDAHYKHLVTARREYEALTAALGPDEEARAQIMGQNAAKILGLD